MVNVLNVQLRVGQDGGQQFAEVEYDLYFTSGELADNTEFGERVTVIEQDEDLDVYINADRIRPPDLVGENWRLPEVSHRDPNTANCDDFVGIVHEATVRPNSQQHLHRSHRRAWRFPAQPGVDQYRALVELIPSISRGAGLSSSVRVNLV